MQDLSFNPPPGWPKPPAGWRPPAGWTPDPSWPPAPEGWELWVSGSVPTEPQPEQPAAELPDGQKQPGDPLVAESIRIAQLEAENAMLRSQLADQDLREMVPLDDAAVLQSVGIYRYHHPLESAAAYKDRLVDLESRIAALVAADQAIVKSNMFTFNNSLAQGRRMTDDLSKLMLRAYNAEADNSLRTLRAGNVQTAKNRLERSRTAIAKLGKLMEMRISDVFHDLRVEEIELTADWLLKKQEEREAQREERARLREEAKVAKELADQRSQLDKERAHVLNALAVLQRSGATDDDLLARLAEIDGAIRENDFRAANIRAGYVYVISNEGAFGPDVVKIGLTRRLEPKDRIAELSGASVPFRFDIHALHFSDDAVTLETELHKHFANRALNRANPRKEFFFASPAEVRDVLLQRVGNLLEYFEAADATEFRQSVGLWPRARGT